MAKIKLIIDSEERDILSFSTGYFEPHPQNPAWKKPFATMEDFENFYSPRAFKPFAPRYGYQTCPYGGTIHIIMASTDNDDFFYNVLFKETSHRGFIEIYNARDEEQPVRKIEFWDAYIVQISEEFHGYSNIPMLLYCTISPAIARYNNHLVFKQSWHTTNIDLPVAPIYQREEETRILIEKVKGTRETRPGQEATYRVIQYNRADSEVSQADRNRIRWAVKAGEERINLENRGEEITLTIREEWAGKEIIVMAFLHSAREDVGERTKVADTREYIVIPQTGFIRKDFSITPQMERYRINRRLSNEVTVQRLLRERSFDNLVVERGIERIVRDYNTSYGNRFPELYYDDFGRFITVQAENVRRITSPDASRAERWAMALEDVSRLVNSESPGRFDHGFGAPLFHIYESIVRRNDDTGIDKLLHFLHSAKYAFTLSPFRSFVRGVAKEANDERQRLLSGEGEGWCNLDMVANRRGIQFGRELRRALR